MDSSDRSRSLPSHPVPKRLTALSVLAALGGVDALASVSGPSEVGPGRGRRWSYAGAGPQAGRNDPCPCNSGKKYKRCCIRKGR